MLGSVLQGPKESDEHVRVDVAPSEHPPQMVPGGVREHYREKEEKVGDRTAPLTSERRGEAAHNGGL